MPAVPHLMTMLAASLAGIAVVLHNGLCIPLPFELSVRVVTANMPNTVDVEKNFMFLLCSRYNEKVSWLPAASVQLD